MSTVGTVPRIVEAREERWFSKLRMAAGTRSMSTEIDPVLRSMHEAIPRLDATKHKGQCGKIAVVGGCEEYTGAPFFAAMTALYAGADLSHVFCGKSASGVIKGYSPDLIVHPYLPDDEGNAYGGHAVEEKEIESVSSHCADRVKEWIPKFDCLVVGPGMGRSKAMLATVAKVIASARQAEIPIVLDADGLFLLTKGLDLIAGYEKAILTPNAVELQRLAHAAGLPHKSAEETACNLSHKLGGVTILSKGPNDYVCCKDSSLSCTEEGSPRRAGGQGDVLAGFVGLFSAWVHTSSTDFGHAPRTLVASYSGCVLAREASRLAYARLGRSLTAFEVTKEVGRAMQNKWGSLP